MMTKRVVFLDIDGPMIPSYMYLYSGGGASFDRAFSPIALMILKNVLLNSGAKLVTKSMHNYMKSTKGNDLKTDLINAGIKEEWFHEDWRTQFGYSMNSRMGRHESIEDWLHKNPDYTEWVDFDDEYHTNDKRLVLVDFDEGLHMRHFQTACDIFGISRHKLRYFNRVPNINHYPFEVSEVN